MDDPILNLVVGEQVAVIFPSQPPAPKHTGRVVFSEIAAVDNDKIAVVGEWITFDRASLPAAHSPIDGIPAFAFMFHPESKWVQRTVAANARARFVAELRIGLFAAIDALNQHDFPEMRRVLAAVLEQTPSETADRD